MNKNIFKEVDFIEDNISKYSICDNFDVSTNGAYLTSIYKVVHIETKDNKKIFIVFENNLTNNVSLTNSIHLVCKSLYEKYNLNNSNTKIIQLQHDWEYAVASHEITYVNESVDWKAILIQKTCDELNIKYANFVLHLFNKNEKKYNSDILAHSILNNNLELTKYILNNNINNELISILFLNSIALNKMELLKFSFSIMSESKFDYKKLNKLNFYKSIGKSNRSIISYICQHKHVIDFLSIMDIKCYFDKNADEGVYNLLINLKKIHNF
jgi:hypothetical protein